MDAVVSDSLSTSRTSDVAGLMLTLVGKQWVGHQSCLVRIGHVN